MTWLGILFIIGMVWLWYEIKTAPLLDEYGNQIEDK